MLLWIASLLLQFSIANSGSLIHGKVPGDLLVGGLFPAHGRGRNGACNMSHVQRDGIFSLEAFYFSLDQLSDQVLMPCCGFRLGAVTVDTCMSEREGLHKTLQFVVRHLIPPDQQSVRSQDGFDVVGIVGPMHSAVAEQVANLLSMFRMPMISYMGTSPTLSKYPYFLRTVPSDTNQAAMLVQILLQWNWSYVHGIYEDSTYGTKGFQAFESMATQNGICFADKFKIDIDNTNKNQIDYYREQLREMAKKQKARVVVVYANAQFASMIFKIAKEEKLDEHFVFIGTDGWGSRHISSHLLSAIEGSIVSIPAYEQLPGFEEYFYNLKPSTNSRNPWFKVFWESIHKCRFDPTPGFTVCNEKEQRIQDVVQSWEFGYMHFVREAVMAYGYSLKKMHSLLCGATQGVCDQMRAQLDKTDSALLLEHLQNGSFPGVQDHQIKFFNGRDGLPIYSIMNYQRKADGSYHWVQIRRLGAIDSEHPGNDSVGPIKFRDGTIPRSVCGTHCPEGHYRKYHRDKCCWTCHICPFPKYKFNETTCIDCPNIAPNFTQPNKVRNACIELYPIVVGFNDPSVIAVTSLAGLGLCLTALTAALFSIYSHTPIIKASGRELSIVLLIGISLCYTTVFLVVLEPTSYTCAFVRFLYSVSYSVCYSSIFVKTNRIVRIFQHSEVSNKPRRTKYINPVSQIVAVALIIGFQCILNAVWLALRRPVPDFLIMRDYEKENTEVYRFCEAFEDEDMLVALILPIVLLLLTALYCFKARKCPGKFNETKYIIITTYTTCIVWIAFIPVFFATERIPVRLFALSATLALNATVTLICMFAPKLYVALIRPHKNTKDNVMGRKGTNLSLANNYDSNSRNDLYNVNSSGDRDREPLAKASVAFTLSSDSSSVRMRPNGINRVLSERCVGQVLRNQAVQTDVSEVYSQYGDGDVAF